MANADNDDFILDVKSWLKRTYKKIHQNKAISGSEVQDLDENCKFPAHPWLPVDELKRTSHPSIVVNSILKTDCTLANESQ